MGPTGTQGPGGSTGADGEEGHTPTLLTNNFNAVLQFANGDDVIEVQNQSVLAPGSGGLIVRAYFNGSVAKRAGAPTCLVKVQLRRDQDVAPLDSQTVGIRQGSTAEREEITVGGVLASQVLVAGGDRIVLRVELAKESDECASGGGATQIAQIVSRLEVQYFRFTLGE